MTDALTTTVEHNGREIGYVEPQSWLGSEDFAAIATFRGGMAETIGTYGTAKQAAAAVREFYLSF